MLKSPLTSVLKQPKNQFKPVQQSRQMVPKVYCSTIHTITNRLSLSAFFLPFSPFPSLFLRFPTFHLRIFHSSSISTNDPSTTACHIQTSRYVLSLIYTYHHNIYIRTVRSQLLLCSGTFVFFLVGLWQKSSVMRISPLVSRALKKAKNSFLHLTTVFMST